MSPNKPQIRSLVRAHPAPYEFAVDLRFWTSSLTLQLAWVSGWHCHTLSHSTVLPPCSLNLRDTVSHQKAVTRVLSPGCYQSDGQHSPCWFLCLIRSVVHLRHSPRLTRRMNPSSGSTVLWRMAHHFSWWSRRHAPVTRELKDHCLCNPRNEPPGNVMGNSNRDKGL
jgi:hypothetical protein